MPEAVQRRRPGPGLALPLSVRRRAEIPRLQAMTAVIPLIRGARRVSPQAACRYCEATSRCGSRTSTRSAPSVWREEQPDSCTPFQGSPVQMRTAAEDSDLPCSRAAAKRQLARRKLGDQRLDLRLRDLRYLGEKGGPRSGGTGARRHPSRPQPSLDLEEADISGPSSQPPAVLPLLPPAAPARTGATRGEERCHRRGLLHHHGVWFDLDELGNLLRWIRTVAIAPPQAPPKPSAPAVLPPGDRRHIARPGTALPTRLGNSARRSGRGLLGGTLDRLLRPLEEPAPRARQTSGRASSARARTYRDLPTPAERWRGDRA